MNYDEIGRIDQSTFGRIEAARDLALEIIHMPYDLQDAYSDFSDGLCTEAAFSELLKRSLDIRIPWDDALDDKTQRAFRYTDNVNALEECEEILINTSLIVHRFEMGGCETFATVLDVDRVRYFIALDDSMGKYDYVIPDEEVKIAIGKQVQRIIKELAELCESISAGEMRSTIDSAFTAAGKWVLDNTNSDSQSLAEIAPAAEPQPTGRPALRTEEQLVVDYCDSSVRTNAEISAELNANDKSCSEKHVRNLVNRLIDGGWLERPGGKNTKGVTKKP